MDPETFRQRFSTLQGRNPFDLDLFEGIEAEVTLRGTRYNEATCRGILSSQKINKGLRVKVDVSEKYPLGQSSIQFSGPTNNAEYTVVELSDGLNTLYNVLLKGTSSTLEIEVTLPKSTGI